MTQTHPYVVVLVERSSPNKTGGILMLKAKKEIVCETEENARAQFDKINLSKWAEQERMGEAGETLVSASKVLYRFDEHGNEEELDRKDLPSADAT